MFPLSLPVYVQAPLWVGILYLGYRTYWNISEGATNRRKARERGCEPPTKERPYRYWGLDYFYKGTRWSREHILLEELHKEHEQYGHGTFKLRFLGRPILVTNEPVNIQSILATDFDSWGIGDNRKLAIPLLGAGIFSNNGAAWRHSRDLLRPNFNRSQVADVALFERHVKHLIRAIPRDGATIDLEPLFFRLSMDVSTEFLFGQSTDDLAAESSSPETVKFVDAWNRCTNLLSGGGGWRGLLTVYFGNGQFNKDCKIIHAFADDFIAKALSKRSTEKFDPGESPQRYIFLDQLLEQLPDPAQIRAELLNILIAGRETTACLLSNLVFTLAQRPDIQARLRAEIDDLDDLEFETIKNLRYLRAFINESLRMYPIVPQNARQAAADAVLPSGGGPNQQSPIFVPKGTLVGYNIHSMQRRKDLYGEDAEEFKCERWLDEDGKKGIRPGWAFLPFNGGPRICIGQQFALYETSYILIRLLQEFSAIESRDSGPWRENLTMTCTVFPGCNIVVTPRT